MPANCLWLRSPPRYCPHAWARGHRHYSMPVTVEKCVNMTLGTSELRSCSVTFCTCKHLTCIFRTSTQWLRTPHSEHSGRWRCRVVPVPIFHAGWAGTQVPGNDDARVPQMAWRIPASAQRAHVWNNSDATLVKLRVSSCCFNGPIASIRLADVVTASGRKRKALRLSLAIRMASASSGILPKTWHLILQTS